MEGLSLRYLHNILTSVFGSLQHTSNTPNPAFYTGRSTMEQGNSNDTALLDALRSAPADVAVFDRSGRLVFHTHQLMGNMPQIKNGLIFFLDSLTKEPETCAILDALADCQESIFIARQTGDSRYWEVRINGGPETEVTPVFIRDVSDREEQERINRILLELIERTLDPIGIARPDHHGLYVNPAMRALFGVNNSVPASAVRIEDVQPSNIGPLPVSSALQRAVEEGPFYTETMITRQSDGERLHVSQMLMSHLDPVDGQTYFSTAIRDITESKKMEAALHQTQIELEKLLIARTEDWLKSSEQATYAQQVWRSLVEKNADLVLFTDDQGEILYANNGFLKKSGLPLVGLYIKELVSIDDWSKIEEQFASLATGQRMHFSEEARLSIPDGQQYFCSMSVNHVSQKNGGHAATWMIADITEHRAAREQLAISERMAASGRIAARVAHEINNPLAAIQNSVSLIRMDIPEQSEAREYLDLMERELKRVASIIRQMYGLYQRNQNAATRVDLASTCKEVIMMLRAQAGSRSIILHNKKMAKAFSLVSEASLRQVLYNVIINAIDASPDNSCIDIEIFAQEPWAIIDVLDRGKGISPDDALKLFEPFYTTKETYSGKGLGLGLPVSLSMVNSVGGQISLTPREGGGTRCRISLPLAP
jgi:PAS domain S-box-containing protein